MKRKCVLGVLKTAEGLRIKEEMLGWLNEKYDVTLVEVDPPNDNGYKVVTSTKLGELKNIKLAISSTHWDSNKMMIFDWKFCPVCGDELSKDAR